MGLKFKYLHKVDGDANNNKFYRMNENADGTFTATYGREGAARPQTETYPMSKWDSKLKEKLSTKKGYTDVTEHRTEATPVVKNSNGVNIISHDRHVQEVIQALQAYAKAQTAEVYKSEAKGVTQKQIDDAQAFIDVLSGMFEKDFETSDWSINKFNAELTKLYIVIPRKMRNVADHLISTDWDKKRIGELIEQEQSNLDAMAGQVVQQTAVDDAEDEPQQTVQTTLLEMLGLKVEPASQAEIDMVKLKAQEHAKRITKVFRVVNENTQKAFDAILDKASNKKIDLLWHGSRNQNWWFIVQQGLKIRPSTAVYTGSMWADGCYFASSADKSMGYTDNGRWVNGRATGKVYMSLYTVHVGKQLVKTRHDSSCYNIDKECKAKGYDSVHAKAGAGIVRDEFIIYNHAQCTISYLVEFSA